MFVRYNPRLNEIARKLRKESTLSEVLLWQQLKGRKFLGLDFHRQKPIDEFIVDFYCPSLRLIIEIDGESHNFSCDRDKSRRRRLEELEFHVLRYLDEDVKRNMKES